MKKVYCLMAYSGAGKTEVAKALEQKGYNVLQSYTTRSPRSENEWGHTFCSYEEYEKFKENDDIAAYTYFDGNHYFSTKKQLNETDIYVIDPDGITYLKENVKDIEFVTIYLKVDKKARMKRMFVRGDDVDQMLSRINGDGLKFRKKRFDYQVINYEFDKAVNIIEYIMKVENSN
ncbi:AAA family ATPase [Paenibacillus sp. HJL G12]|uniref:AAA family ATPase n=1 Tax=Paenibacillus dendrobii TaxID=2691084 RepID=A0A7X3IJK5_9BACL|nr:AAA family ATPase [Paenibacillus dendrobii]MWV44890.1 AAA family ATPase [Paenibacillus dendrobii]